MGRYLTKMMFLVLTSILSLHLLISSSSGWIPDSLVKPNDENGVCTSKGGRFPPYKSEGNPPKPAYFEFKDLNLCKVFHGALEMHWASLAVENLATYGEAAKDFLNLFELLECSICHPHVGMQSGPLRICASFCDRVFEVIVPCGARHGIICRKASKWESNGTAFCNALGFTVQAADDSAEEPCYGSNTTLEPMIPSLIKADNYKLFQDLQPLTGKITEAHMRLNIELSWYLTLQRIAQTAANSAKEPSYGSKASLEQVMESAGPSEKTPNFERCSSGESVNSNETGVCISKGGRFPPYESEGNPPEPAYLEFKDLNMCKVFHGNTCCSASQMHSASLAVSNMATYGEAVQDCLYLFELLECSICHPNVGIQSGPPRICASFCDRVFEACSDAYFSSNARNQVIVPCGVSEGIICGKASKWESNGTAFCDAVGFTVLTADDSVEEPCYGSNPSLEPVVETLIKTEKLGWFQDFQKLVSEMTLVQQISWLVLPFVLGTMYFNRWRYQQQIQAMIERNARRLIGNMNGNA